MPTLGPIRDVRSVAPVRCLEASHQVKLGHSSPGRSQQLGSTEQNPPFQLWRDAGSSLVRC